MALEKTADKIVETDVLVVGGGVGGCPCAAKAAQQGLKVTLAEKANTERSGSAGGGEDHYGGALPRGITVKEWREMAPQLEPILYGGRIMPFSDPTRLYRQYANGMWAIEELEKLGITMRWDDGELRTIRFTHGIPFTRVHWTNVKPEMARAVRKRGVNVLERTMVVDLLTSNGSVVGAIAINTRNGEFIVIKAKAVVLATGYFARGFEPDMPSSWKYKFRYHFCPPAQCGDGWAMAYRAGAELANMELSGAGHLPHDVMTLSPGNFGNEGVQGKVVTWDGEEIPTHWVTPIIHSEMEQKGRTPIYRSLEDIPDDFHKRIEVAIADEKMISFKLAEERGFNPRTHWYQMMPNRPLWLGEPPGINLDADFMSTVKGLYAIGDAMAGNHDIANACVSGLLVGESLPAFASQAREPVVDEAQVESQKQAALAPLTVQDGTEPMELECAIRNITREYAPLYKSEGMLREGLRRLRSLRRVFLPRLMAKNPHYLMRAMECRNIMDLVELHMQACLARKESRTIGGAYFLRSDYPNEEPSLNGLLCYQRLEEGNPTIEFRKLTPMILPDNHTEER